MLSFETCSNTRDIGKKYVLHWCCSMSRCRPVLVDRIFGLIRQGDMQWHLCITCSHENWKFRALRLHFESFWWAVLQVQLNKLQKIQKRKNSCVELSCVLVIEELCNRCDRRCSSSLTQDCNLFYSVRVANCFLFCALTVAECHWFVFCFLVSRPEFLLPICSCSFLLGMILSMKVSSAAFALLEIQCAPNCRFVFLMSSLFWLRQCLGDLLAGVSMLDYLSNLQTTQASCETILCFWEYQLLSVVSVLHVPTWCHYECYQI